MDITNNDIQKKQRRLWWKIPVGIFVLLFMFLVVLILNIDSIAHSQINKALKRYLSEGGTLDAINFGLKEGRIVLRGLTINTPKGFGKDPLLSLNTFELDVDPISLFAGEIVVEQLTLKEPSLTVVRDKHGRLSPLNLLSSKKPAFESQAVEDSGNKEPLSLPSFRVDSIRIENFSVLLFDKITGEHWSAGFRINLSIDGLLLKDLLKQNIIADKVLVVLNEIKVDQPAGYSKTPLATVKRFELASAGIDLTTKRLSVDNVLLEQLKVSVERNKKGAISLLQLIDAWTPADSSTEEKSKKKVVKATAKDGSKADIELPSLLFEDMQFQSIAIQMLDHAGKEPWRAGFENLDISLAGLSVGDLTRKAFSLDSFVLDLKGMSVDQPPGFDAAKIAELERLKITTGKLDLASPEMIVKQVLIQRPKAIVVVNNDGFSNIRQLNQKLFGSDEEMNKSEKKPEAKSEEPLSDNKLPVIRFEKVQMERGSFKYLDKALTEEALILPLEKIQLMLTQLRLLDKNIKTAPASASLSFEIEQPKELPTAYFGSLAVVGPVSKGAPPANCQIRLTGFKLDTLGSLVPKATRTTLGADGFDAGLALAMNNEQLDLFASILSDRNIYYDALKVSGPLYALKVELGAVLAGVFSRVSSGLVNLGKGGIGTGFTVARVGVDTVKELGSGTMKVGKNLGESLLGIGSGLLGGNRENLNKGLTGVTKDTFGRTVESIRETGSTAGMGLKDSLSTLKGNNVLKAWDHSIPTRHRAVIKQAEDALAKMLYPPVID